MTAVRQQEAFGYRLGSGWRTTIKPARTDERLYHCGDIASHFFCAVKISGIAFLFLSLYNIDNDDTEVVIMDIYMVRQELKTKSIYDLPLRVTFYARVSTDSDDQKNSLENQSQYYEEFINSNKNWTYVPGYIDEGISGATTKKRENFNLMIEDAKNGKFDFVITKELSRFARNTLDSIKYTRDLLSYGVCVLFQGDGINTIDEDSELRLTIMAGIAQDELRKLSSRVKFGHQQAIKNGVVLGNSRMFGYIKKDKRLVIDESEAHMVRELFELYATDQYSLKQIERIF